MKFFVIEMNLFDDRLFAYTEQVDFETGEAPRCPECNDAVGQREWLPPYHIKLSKPSYGDFAYGSIAPFVVTERVVRLYSESGLKGIESFQPLEVVKVARKRNTSQEPPMYYQAIIPYGGSRTEINPTLSHIEYMSEPTCQFCKLGTIYKYQNVVIDEDTWDGIDVFKPIGLPGTIVVTERFRDFAELHGFTNLKLVPSTEYECPY